MTAVRLRELDSLRGIAALMVVAYHFTTRYQEFYGHSSPVLSLIWGREGVPLFFGLSGFVISMTLNHSRTAMDFAVSRFSRLYPAYVTAIILTSIVVYAGHMRLLEVSMAATAIDFTMMEAFLRVPYVDGVYWTLEAEIFFYAVVFGLLVIRKGAWLDAVLLGWIALNWAWRLNPLSYTVGLLMMQYAPYFAIGVACFRLWAKEKPVVPVLLTIPFAIVSLWVIYGARFGITGGLVALVLLLAVYGKLSALRWAAFRGLGAISYTLYLLHENIGWTIIRNLENAGVHPYCAIGAALAACVLLALVVSRLIEQPAMAFIRRVWSKYRQPYAPSERPTPA